MKKFFFRLETLLRVRLAQEGAMKQELKSAEQKMFQSIEKEKTLQGQITLLIEEMKHKRSEGKLQAQGAYTQILEHLQSALAQVQSTLAAQKKQVAEHKERFKQAIQQRKVIEKIKEKHYAGWRLRESLSEGALLDEIALKKSADSE